MNFSYKGYVRYLRKQHVHVQKVHAAVFAGVISLGLFALVLYVEYGYWDVTYERKEEIKQEEVTVLKESPTEALGRLITEGKTRFNDAMKTLEPLRGGGTTFERAKTDTGE